MKGVEEMVVIRGGDVDVTGVEELVVIGTVSGLVWGFPSTATPKNRNKLQVDTGSLV